jgi:hypothetical protein
MPRKSSYEELEQRVKELEGVDFKTTGTQLKKEGWRCIGPGLEFERLLEGEDNT